MAFFKLQTSTFSKNDSLIYFLLKCLYRSAAQYRDKNFMVFLLYCFDEWVSSCVALTQARLLKVSIFSEEYRDISTQACTCRAMETGTILLCFMGL